MGRVLVHMVLMTGTAFALAGCGFADVRSPVPEFMRSKAPEPPPLEPAPDVRKIVGEKLDSVFLAAAQPTAVRVSAPRHEARGNNWTACVRAELVSVTGKPLGTQTYRITITNNLVADRRRVEPDDLCMTETYQPV